MTVTQYPRIANLGDLPRLIQDDRVTWQWPPPGTTVQLLAFPELWVEVVGDAVGDVGDWYVTTLSQVAGYFPEHVEQILVRASALFTGPVAAFAGSVGALPVIYEIGRNNRMRWISSTFRGLLGSTEQFQYGINWGNPGADPDPNEAGTLAFAEQLAVQWGAAIIGVGAFGALQSAFSTQVKWTEVGAVVKTQTDGTNADGTGGNLEQKFDTQWHAYPVGSQPTGSGGATSLPYEVSQAVTLQTDKRGPSGRGRLYLPPYSTSQVDLGGLFPVAVGSKAGDCFGRFFETMTGLSGYVPVIVSRRRIVLNEVTSINVGVVPDSQRRRRRSQNEARVTYWTKD